MDFLLDKGRKDYMSTASVGSEGEKNEIKKMPKTAIGGFA